MDDMAIKENRRPPVLAALRAKRVEIDLPPANQEVYFVTKPDDTPEKVFAPSFLSLTHRVLATPNEARAKFDAG